MEWLDAKQALAEMSIPGMRAIFGKRPHIARRITWILILVICTAFSGVQVGNTPTNPSGFKQSIN